jgi:hypothetical protein
MKYIENLNELYSISEDGRVWSCKKEKYLTPISNGNGYFTVKLKGTKYFIHRLVAKAFIENNDDKNVVNHKDGVKSNNNVNNLEWVTYKENSIHANKNSLVNGTEHKKILRKSCKAVGLANKGKVFKSRKLNIKQDEEITKRFLNGESSIKLAVEFGVSKRTILNIKNGRNYA